MNTNMEIYKLQADIESEGLRIDKYLTSTLDFLSRSYIQKMIKESNVSVNGKLVKANYCLREDDEITFYLPPLVEPDIVAEDIPLDILYEDSDIIIINKPKNMVVHPAAGHYSGTLVNALMFHCKDSLSGINGVMRPGIVHRIDKDTTGSLVVCKNDFSHEIIAAQLKEHSITRKYRAICHGILKEDEYRIEKSIGRHPVERKKMAINEKHGKNAITNIKVLERLKNATYIECKLETGRTHQIRVHLSSIGHPLLGDDIYGGVSKLKQVQGQTLHAHILGFIHPRSKEYLEIEAPMPDYFNKLLQQLRI